MSASIHGPREEGRALYRSRDGWLFGVCKGIADYSGIGVGWVRFTVILVALFTGIGLPMTIAGYVIAAILMKPAPVLKPNSIEDWEFYNSYASDRYAALSRLKKKMEGLERRAQRMENVVTAREYDWERRFHQS